MVVLLDGSVVVEQSRLRARHDVEAIGRSRMLKVVYDGGQNGGKDLQIGQPVLQKTIIQVGTCPSAVSSTFLIWTWRARLALMYDKHGTLKKPPEERDKVNTIIPV